MIGLDGHVEYCKRFRSSAYKQPWGRGILAHEPLPCILPWIPKGPFPLHGQLQNVEPDVDDLSGPKLLVPCYMNAGLKLDRVSKGQTWHEKLDASRALGLKKWLTILTAGGVAFDMVQQHFAVQSASQILLIDALELALTSKSTSTLHARANPVIRLMKWCKDHALQPFPLDHVLVFKYLESIRDVCAPTYPKSVLGSIAFMTYCLGLKSGHAVLGSQMVTGLSASLFLKKRKTVQRPPLKVWHVKRLESIACGRESITIIDQVAAGFFCFLVYGRARFSDGQNARNFVLDVIDGSKPPQGFLEASIQRSKTSYTLERKTRHLPMVAQVTGLSDVSWAIAWTRAMKKSGFQTGAGLPLLPAPLMAGEWDAVPISAEAATKWIRKLLLDAPGLDDAEREYILQLGTHSCKTTILSWAAKKGTDPQTRKIMGYHSLGKQNAVFIYGRDNIAPALREISEIVTLISTGKFLPDKTRSGYFATEGEDKDGGVNNLDPTPDELRGDSSSEDSADGDHAEHSDAEQAVDAVVGKWTGDFDPDILPTDPEQYLRHGVSRVLHLISDESGTSLTCGRPTTKSYERLRELPTVLHPVCKQCFALFARDFF